MLAHIMVQHDQDEERLARIDYLVETLQRETASLRVDTAILVAGHRVRSDFARRDRSVRV